MSVHIHDKYTFHITAPNGTTWQCYPRNAQLEWKWERTEWNFKRKILDTTLVFVNDPANSIDDFDRLLAIEESSDRCNFILIDVFLLCNEVETSFWQGRISCTLGQWDKSYCRFSVKPEPNDEYTCLFENWEDEHDFASGLVGRTIEISPEYAVETKSCFHILVRSKDAPKPGIVQLLDLLSTAPDNQLETIRALVVLNAVLQCSELGDAGSSAWTYLSSNYITYLSGGTLETISYEITITLAREYAHSTCDPDPVAPDDDPTWVLFEDNCPTDSLWVRQITSGILYNNDSSSEIINDQTIKHIRSTGFYPTIIYNSYRLKDVLEWYMEQFCELQIISNLFNINPDDTNPDNSAYDQAALGLLDVHIQHLSDFIKTEVVVPDADGDFILPIYTTQKARVAVALKTILLSLPNNVSASIEGNTIRIEHASYFTRIQMLDLTQADHVKMISGNAKYDYNKEKLPKREKFSWKGTTDGQGRDFDGLPIEYASPCIDPENKETPISFDAFYSNVAYLFFNREQYDNDLDGLIIYSVGDERVLSDYCPISGLLKANGHFAISTLHQNYWKWDRPLPTGIMNGDPTQFFRWLRQKQQSDIKVRMCCDDYGTFDPDDLAKTQLGWGEVDEATLTEPTGILTLELLHH